MSHEITLTESEALRARIHAAIPALAEIERRRQQMETLCALCPGMADPAPTVARLQVSAVALVERMLEVR